MLIQDISFSKIEILNPVLEDNSYIFKINYNNENLDIQLNNEIIMNEDNNDIFSLNNKLDLNYLHKIYNYLVKVIFDSQDKWFENNFSINELNNMFNNYLKPNYENNCIDILCKIPDNLNLDKNVKFIPIFRYNSIIFNGSSFSIDLTLNSFEYIINNDNDNTLVKTINAEETHIDNNTENNCKDNNDIDNSIEGLEENTPNDNTEEELVNTDNILINDNNQNNNENNVEEIDVSQLNNIESINMKINEDDFDLLHKFIQGSIYNNMASSLRDILVKKGIKNIEEIDLNEIIFDIDEFTDNEDDEDSDNEETFEESYSNLVN
tara:strand:- start:1074 stop:2039 length:966 start_codon:yes stop_codon:yes gene_type:complete